MNTMIIPLIIREMQTKPLDTHSILTRRAIIKDSNNSVGGIRNTVAF